jgi:hypothetical protein
VTYLVRRSTPSNVTSNSTRRRTSFRRRWRSPAESFVFNATLGKEKGRVRAGISNHELSEADVPFKHFLHSPPHPFSDIFPADVQYPPTQGEVLPFGLFTYRLERQKV